MSARISTYFQVLGIYHRLFPRNNFFCWINHQVYVLKIKGRSPASQAVPGFLFHGFFCSALNLSKDGACLSYYMSSLYCYYIDRTNMISIFLKDKIKYIPEQFSVIEPLKRQDESFPLYKRPEILLKDLGTRKESQFSSILKINHFFLFHYLLVFCHFHWASL